MSAQTETLEPHEQALVALMERFEPVVDVRPHQLRDCGGGCGRVVSAEVVVCVRCRHTSAHPSLRGRPAR